MGFGGLTDEAKLWIAYQWGPFGEECIREAEDLEAARNNPGEVTFEHVMLVAIGKLIPLLPEKLEPEPVEINDPKPLPCKHPTELLVPHPDPTRHTYGCKKCGCEISKAEVIGRPRR